MNNEIDEGEQRLLENNKKSPQRHQGGLKGEELKSHNIRMGSFMSACKKNKGFWTKAYANTDELILGVENYLNCISEIGLFPTLTGLALYLDINLSTIYAAERLNDERSRVFEKFRTYISEYFNQNGLASNSNPVFSIYYGKSVLGQSDTPQMNVNVNFNNSSQLNCDEIANAIAETPDEYIEVDYKDVEG